MFAASFLPLSGFLLTKSARDKSVLSLVGGLGFALSWVLAAAQIVVAVSVGVVFPPLLLPIVIGLGILLMSMFVLPSIKNPFARTHTNNRTVSDDPNQLLEPTNEPSHHLENDLQTSPTNSMTQPLLDQPKASAPIHFFEKSPDSSDTSIADSYIDQIRRSSFS